MAATVFRRSHLTTVEILDLRHFSSADLRSLLEEEVETWRNLLFWDYRSSADMILRYVDAKILPGYAAVERGSIIGYSFFVYTRAARASLETCLSRRAAATPARLRRKWPNTS
jgi:hypothetical protein